MHRHSVFSTGLWEQRNLNAYQPEILIHLVCISDTTAPSCIAHKHSSIRLSEKMMERGNTYSNIISLPHVLV
jgi:hypothetical protein